MRRELAVADKHVCSSTGNTYIYERERVDCDGEMKVRMPGPLATAFGILFVLGNRPCSLCQVCYYALINFATCCAWTPRRTFRPFISSTRGCARLVESPLLCYNVFIPALNLFSIVSNSKLHIRGALWLENNRFSVISLIFLSSLLSFFVLLQREMYFYESCVSPTSRGSSIVSNSSTEWAIRNQGPGTSQFAAYQFVIAASTYEWAEPYQPDRMISSSFIKCFRHN